jgi:hypothetical protein
MKHWIRDAQITFAAATRGLGQISYLLFHFLRTAGWEWLWECDGYAGSSPNRVPDGNMELSGVANWTALGSGAVAKVTSPVHSGIQALRVTSAAATDGVESATFTSMENSKEYHLSVWAYNDTGGEWAVQVDIGTGYTGVGTIPDNGGVWTLHHFSFTTAVSGNRKLKIIDNLGTTGSVYISDILVFKSYFEYSQTDAWEGGVDGEITNPDQFSSTSYSFVAGDIGKFICVWDPTNAGNSGAYKITAAAGGVATLDLRSGSAALVSQDDLPWRMIDLADAPENTAGSDNGQRGAGFGLQSPHASSWRLFVRQAQYGAAGAEATAVWAAPTDTDFDFSTGTFYRTGPSSQNTKQAAYTLWGGGDWVNTHYWNYSSDATGTNRFFLMTDDDGSFVAMVLWDAISGTNLHDAPVIGYMGSSTYLPGEEAWVLFARWYYSATYNGIYWDSYTDRTFYNGTMIGPDGVTKDAVWGQYGVGSSTDCVITQSNAGDNPWSAEEWIHKPIIVRDPDGSSFTPGEMVADIGVYQGRVNMVNLSTFDSDSYLHFDNGLVWEWSGESILP